MYIDKKIDQYDPISQIETSIITAVLTKYKVSHLLISIIVFLI